MTLEQVNAPFLVLAWIAGMGSTLWWCIALIMDITWEYWDETGKIRRTMREETVVLFGKTWVRDKEISMAPAFLIAVASWTTIFAIS